MTTDAMWNVTSANSRLSSQVRQVLSDESLKLAEDILFVFRYGAVAFAIPLTLCNVVIFLHKNMRSATAVYVIGLSVGQLVYVIGTTLQHICALTFRDPLNDRDYWAVTLYFAIYCGIVSRRGANVVMSLVSLERLYAIVRPLHIKRFFLSRRPLLSMSVAYLFTATLHVYILAKSEVRGVALGRSKTLVYRVAPTQLYLRHRAVNDAFSLTAKILLTYCGFLTQITFNILTIFFLRRHNTATQKMTSSAKEEAVRQRERQMTVTILAATLSYVLLSLPASLHHFIYAAYPVYSPSVGPYQNLYALIQESTFVLSVVSCCLDFVCFVVLSSNYRTTFIAVFTRKMRRPREMPDDMSTQLQSVG